MMKLVLIAFHKYQQFLSLKSGYPDITARHNSENKNTALQDKERLY